MIDKPQSRNNYLQWLESGAEKIKDLTIENERFETIEVVRWECTCCGAYFTIPHQKCEYCNDAVFIELKGSYIRPIPRKVQKRERIHDRDADCHTMRGHAIFAEWEEEE